MKFVKKKKSIHLELHKLRGCWANETKFLESIEEEIFSRTEKNDTLASGDSFYFLVQPKVTFVQVRNKCFYKNFIHYFVSFANFARKICTSSES